MTETPLYRRILSGEAGAWAEPLRAALWLAAQAYGTAVAWRNRRYDADPARVTRVSVPVLSVGNITTGGTGKTPLVIELVRRLQARGRTPAVVSRGYRAGPGQIADELQLVQLRCPGVLAVADPDRVRGSQAAVQAGADVIVLDDAFQHRRIHRDLNIVTIDATCPFGFGHVLPRGLLREPLSGLARADLFVLTRSDLVPADQLGPIEATLRRYNSAAPVLRAAHRAQCLSRLAGGSLDLAQLRDRRVLCVSAVGNPSAFHRTVEQLGARILHATDLPDHARYDNAARRTLADVARRHPDAEYLVTTEKDVVKLDPQTWSSFPLPIAAVAIDLTLAPADSAAVDAAIDGVL
jgi:tetraacyldisaccharide 4'-kinase